MSNFLSPHFSLVEFTRSDRALKAGIDNAAPPHVVANLIIVASELEKLRTKIGKSIKITSGYRSPVLNAMVGGEKNSVHMQGLAADIRVDSMTPMDLAKAIISSSLNYDQVILEPSWVHVGFCEDSTKARKQVLTRTNSNEAGKKYVQGLVKYNY